MRQLYERYGKQLYWLVGLALVALSVRSAVRRHRARGGAGVADDRPSRGTPRARGKRGGLAIRRRRDLPLAGPAVRQGDHWAGWTLEERREEPKPSVGGTLDTPVHEPTEMAPARRVAWWIVGGLALFALLSAALWTFDAIGWRRALAGLSSLLMAIGVGVAYWRLPPDEAKRLWRRELRRDQHTELTPERLTENSRRFSTFVGGVLIALGSVGLIVALLAE